MINYDKIKESLSPYDIIRIIQHFIPDLKYIENANCLILPTICHNLYQEDGSMKLYYYYNSQLFCCYTECDSTFDIYELVKKMLKLREMPCDFVAVFNVISRFSDAFFEAASDIDSYNNIRDKYISEGQEAPIYKVYNSCALKSFQDYYPIEWIKDGITVQSMKKFNIKFSIPNEQIIIPHYDINGNLIGVRARNLDQYQIENVGKYMPAKINGQFYTHPLMYNLYGINFNLTAIKKNKYAMIFEGEKSVLICDGWYGDNNCAVATCGDKFNKYLIKLLVANGAMDIIVCYDRMNFDKKSNEEYFEKLWNMCEKYSQYANFSFIFDREGLIEYKAAPVDRGLEIFEKLLNRRVFVK